MDRTQANILREREAAVRFYWDRECNYVVTLVDKFRHRLRKTFRQADRKIEREIVRYTDRQTHR